MRNLDPGKLSSALAENMRYLENILNTVFNFNHDILSNVGADDHHAKYLDSEVDTIVATHTANASAHHAKYLDSEVDAIVATHAAVVAAHHAKYTDAEAVTAMGVKADANPLNHDQGAGHAAPIATHAAIVAAHHAKYTDAEVTTVIDADTGLFLVDGSRTVTGALIIDEGGTAQAVFNMGDVDGSDDGAFWHFTKRPSDHANANRLQFSEYNGTSWSDWLHVNPGGSAVFDRTVAFNEASAAFPNAFETDVNTGFYRVGADRFGITAGGLLIASFENYGGSNASIRLLNGTESRPAFTFISDPDTGVRRFGADELGLVAAGADRMIIGTYGVKVEGGHLLPRVDNVVQVGSSSLRYVNVWAVDGSINTSDEDEKRDLKPLAFDARAFVHAVEPIQYKHKDGGVRWHVGFGAQQVADSMAAHAVDFGAFIDPSHGKDRTDPQDEVEGENGNPGPLGLRYHELIPVLWQAWKETDTELQLLKERVERLETALSNLTGRR